MSTVLVVDDDPGVRKVASLVLSLEGDAVYEAADGLEALEVLSHEPVDLMVLDLDMPRLDGWQTFEEARREGFSGPVLILSGLAAEAAARELHAEGAMRKPFEPDELVASVHRLVDHGDSANDGQTDS